MKYVEPDWPVPGHIKAFTTLKPCLPRDATGRSTLTNTPNEPIWLKQVHGVDVIQASPSAMNEVADGSFTTETNQICVVLTADCLPLLICNRAGTQVAAVHAGWRGLANGIIENALAKFSSNDELLVWLGPAIGPEKFEVGLDVWHAFTAQDPEAEVAFKVHTSDKWLANLYQLATLRLQKCGVDLIYGGNYCTYTQENLFYSYRRDKGQTGRMASLIWIS